MWKERWLFSTFLSWDTQLQLSICFLFFLYCYFTLYIGVLTLKVDHCLVFISIKLSYLIQRVTFIHLFQINNNYFNLTDERKNLNVEYNIWPYIFGSRVICLSDPVLAVDDRHVTFCEYNGSVARIICVAVATLANEKLLERASDNDLLLCRKSTSNKTCYRQWFDRCIISKMILKSGSNWLFPVVFSVEITLSGSHSGNSFEFSHRLTGFLNYALFCLSFCLRLNLKPVNYLTTRRSSMTNSRSP
jgi:hypothetical protein